MKYIAFCFLALFAAQSFAVDGNVFFNGTVASSCSFNSASAGTVSVSGTSFSSTANGSISVVNNDPGAYTLSIGALTLPTAPNGETISSSTTTTESVTGANTGLVPPAVLTNAGTDVVELSITGTLTGAATAGSYIFQQVVTCAV